MSDTSSKMVKTSLELLAKIHSDSKKLNGGSNGSGSSMGSSLLPILENAVGLSSSSATVIPTSSTPNINNTTNSLNTSNPTGAGPTGTDTKASEWTDEKVKTMLNLRINYKEKFDSRAFKKNKLWDEIASQVNGQFPGTKLTGSMCNDKFRYLKHRYLLSEQYRRVYGGTEVGKNESNGSARHSPQGNGGSGGSTAAGGAAAGQNGDENSIRAPHFIYGHEFNHLFGNDLDTLLMEKTNSRPFIETTNNALANGGQQPLPTPEAKPRNSPKNGNNTISLGAGFSFPLTSITTSTPSSKSKKNNNHVTNNSFDMPSMVNTSSACASGLDLLSDSGVQTLLGLSKRKIETSGLDNDDAKRIKLETLEDLASTSSTPVSTSNQLLFNNALNAQLLNAVVAAQSQTSHHTAPLPTVTSPSVLPTGNHNSLNSDNALIGTLPILQQLQQLQRSMKTSNGSNGSGVDDQTLSNVVNNQLNQSNTTTINIPSNSIHTSSVLTSAINNHHNPHTAHNSLQDFTDPSTTHHHHSSNQNSTNLNNNHNHHPITTAAGGAGAASAISIPPDHVDNNHNSSNSNHHSAAAIAAVTAAVNGAVKGGVDNNLPQPAAETVVSQNLLFSAISRIATSLENQEKSNRIVSEKIISCLESLNDNLTDIKSDLNTLLVKKNNNPETQQENTTENSSEEELSQLNGKMAVDGETTVSDDENQTNNNEIKNLL